MKNTVVKKIVICIVIILVLVVLAIFISKMVAKNNKEYEIVEISEKDYQYFQIYSNDKFGVANSEGKMVIENNYSDIIIPNPTKEVFFCIAEDGSISILNANNEKIFTQFENVDVIGLEGNTSNLPYDKSVLKYEENGKFGLIDYEGNVIVKAMYDEISSVKYKEGEILAKKDGKYGVINNKGFELIPFEYDGIEGDKYYQNSYRDSGYVVKNTTDEGYRYGYINNEWKKMIDTNYTTLSRILDIHGNDVYLIASKDGQYGVIKNKEEVVGFEYQSIIYNQDTNLLSVQRNQNYGVIDLKGEVIVPTQYRSVRFNGMYIYTKSASDDKYFDTKGKEVEQKYTGMKKVERTGFIHCNR